MAWPYDNYYGEPMYYGFSGTPWSDCNGIRYREPAPVTFRTPPLYEDPRDERSFLLQPADRGHGWLLPVPMEQVLTRREDPRPPAPWRLQWDWCPHGGYPVAIAEPPHPCPAEAEESTLEFYAPQLCCDRCERRVVDALQAWRGVENVVADQWEKKVVVVGRDLEPDCVLRRLQRVSHMGRSDHWRNR